VGAYPASSSPGRAANMRANRRVDTKPELALRSALHRRGYRFRKDHRLDLDAGVSLLKTLHQIVQRKSQIGGGGNPQGRRSGSRCDTR